MSHIRLVSRAHFRDSTASCHSLQGTGPTSLLQPSLLPYRQPNISRASNTHEDAENHSFTTISIVDNFAGEGTTLVHDGDDEFSLSLVRSFPPGDAAALGPLYDSPFPSILSDGVDGSLFSFRAGSIESYVTGITNQQQDGLHEPSQIKC